MIESLLENKEEIVLDAANNVFVGPENYFKIVIDSFDGKTIKAWHVEGPKGEKSSNLAAFSKGQHLDALINKSNGTVSAFYTKFAPDALLHFLPDVPDVILNPPPPAPEAEAAAAAAAAAK